MARAPKVGFHDFLNSKPLLHPFRHGLVAAPFELVIDTPSRLADRFQSGELDMALIPSIEYARARDAVIVPGVCIASLGKVETVLVYTDRALEDIESVAADARSRTSVAMLEILFRHKFGRIPTITPVDEAPNLMLRDADAGLVIGDAAFHVDRARHIVHDLGELWYQHSGRPFVHAVLCAHKGERWDAAIAAIVEAKQAGMRHRELVARQETRSPDDMRRAYEYLTARIFYDLGEAERDGLAYFLSAARELGLCERDELVFYPAD